MWNLLGSYLFVLLLLFSIVKSFTAQKMEWQDGVFLYISVPVSQFSIKYVRFNIHLKMYFTLMRVIFFLVSYAYIRIIIKDVFPSIYFYCNLLRVQKDIILQDERVFFAPFHSLHTKTKRVCIGFCIYPFSRFFFCFEDYVEQIWRKKYL